MNKSWWEQFQGRAIENKYVLRRLLGTGGFGGVFQADHIVQGTLVRRVAVKLIVSDEEEMQRQLGELVAASNLRHPSLVGCFDVGATNFESLKLLYLVMELAEEGLDTRLSSSSSFSPADAMKLTRSLAEGLAYLHEQRRVHRDVKPSNVLLVDGTWKLSDFGALRESAETISHTGLILGTIEYMPPESFDGVVSPAWDLWSLGVVVLRALTGRSPYPGLTGQQLMRAILEKEADIPASLPAPFGDMVRGCLVKDHHQRCDALRLLAMSQRTIEASTLRPPSLGLPGAGPPSDEMTVRSQAPRPRVRVRILQKPRELKWVLSSFAVLLLALIGILWLVSLRNRPDVSAHPISRVSKPADTAPQAPRYDYNIGPLERNSGPAPHVTIFNLSGSATITGANVEFVKVTARRTIHMPDQAGADRANQGSPVEVNLEGDGVTVRTNQERLAGHPDITTDLEIIVPKGASVVARGGRGDVMVSNVEGAVVINKDRADVQLRNIDGDVRVDLTESKSIRAAAIRGTAELNIKSTVGFKAERVPGEVNYTPGQLNGSNIEGPIHLVGRGTNIHLTGFTDELEARLIAGDLTLRPGGTEPPPMMVTTESGNIDLALPPVPAFELMLKTENGSAENAYGAPLRLDGESGASAGVSGGLGGPQLRLTTRRGKVTVRKLQENSF